MSVHIDLPPSCKKHWKMADLQDCLVCLRHDRIFQFNERGNLLDLIAEIRAMGCDPIVEEAAKRLDIKRRAT